MGNMRGFALFIVTVMNREQVIKSYQNTNLVYPPANKITQTIFFKLENIEKENDILDQPHLNI